MISVELKNIKLKMIFKTQEENFSKKFKKKC